MANPSKGTRKPLAPRLFAKVRRNTVTGCLEWVGSLRRGYGFLQHEGKRVAAHRAAWFVHHGAWPADDIKVCHTCDNRRCVEKEHLFLGSTADNLADAVQKDRQARGERNGQAKLTLVQVQSIVERLQRGERQYRLAKEYGVTAQMVYLIKTGQKWARSIELGYM